MNNMHLRPLYHRGKWWLGIYYEINGSINNLVRLEFSARWSRTHRCWYTALSRQQHVLIRKKLSSLAEIDDSALETYWENETYYRFEEEERRVKEAAKEKPVLNWGLCESNLQALLRTVQHLTLKSYSPSTVTSYRSELLVFFRLLKNHRAEDLTREDVKRYLEKCLRDGLTENTLHSRINALKYFYEKVLGRQKFFLEIPRPKKHLQLPRFFTQDEITSIIKASGNIKHRTMLMLTYSAGLRVSETVALRISQIDEQRRCIYVRRAKGKKDRIVQLSPVLIVAIREYRKEYNLYSDGYLFPGQYPGQCYSTRSLQLVLSAAKKQAGILKPGSVHALRHSFATHLLDKGTDVTMIMKLLGHNSIKTTLRYLHVTNRDLLQVISPIDDLDL